MNRHGCGTGDFRLSADGPRFLCDNNVHRLGRSLRMLGYDTLLFGSGPDERLRQIRERSARILLTRDSDFLNEEQTLVLSSDFYLEQLRTVVRSYSLDPVSYRYSLCLGCNRPIRRVAAEPHKEAVPDWVVDEEKPLWQCPSCRKLYWAGSHLDRMNERFARLFE